MALAQSLLLLLLILILFIFIPFQVKSNAMDSFWELPRTDMLLLAIFAELHAPTDDGSVVYLGGKVCVVVHTFLLLPCSKKISAVYYWDSK